ncbi:MAG: hypothetical protein P8Z39_08015, partial [Gammaproteobacteria bacterium]
VLMTVAWAVVEIYTIKKPNVHLTGVRGAIKRGEILLMVDVPKQRVREIATTIGKYHPEKDYGVVGWNLKMLMV